jgi:hypothetical protein
VEILQIWLEFGEIVNFELEKAQGLNITPCLLCTHVLTVRLWRPSQSPDNFLIIVAYPFWILLIEVTMCNLVN